MDGSALPALPALALLERLKYLDRLNGWVAERLKAPVLKTGKPARVSRVRIPPHPPISMT